jgi:hypothetical protein
MIKSGPSNVKKFQFFEVIKESSVAPPEDQEIDEPDKDKNIPIHLQKSNISINNVSVAGARQMHAINGLVFINGKAIHKKEGKNIRESLVLKILDNKIIDEYRVYNGVYYDFSIKIFEEIPYFVIVGGNFNEYIIDGQKELFMTTFIKIYNATKFIEDKTGRMPVPPGLGPTDEPYPDLLVKRIKLLKRLSDDKLVCDTEGDKMEGYESFQNINAFSISDNFTHAAVSLDKGGILLIYGKPNMLECSTKEMKMIYLPKIMVKDREAHITNLNFVNLRLNNYMKRILYASTANSVYYYIWDYEVEKYSTAENRIELKELNQDGKGAYSGCIDIKDRYLLMGSSMDDFIGEYENLEFGKTWFFDGKKTIVKYYNEYIVFVIFGETESSLQIYDKTNQFFVYYDVGHKKIIGVCSDENNYLYAFYEETPVKKYIAKLREKKTKEKFDIFFEKKFFDDAVIYAENLGFNKQKISEISLKRAEYEYSKGDFRKSIDEYIKTINYYEPSNVIQKYLEQSKLDYLIKYLEAIVDNIDFKIKALEDYKNYTTLLLNCYITQEEFHKLKEFIDQKGKYFSEDIIKTVIKVCLQAEKIDIALSIAKKNKLIEEYLKILIIKLNRYGEAIDILEESEQNDLKVTNKDKIDLYYKFGEYFLKTEGEKEDYSDKFFNSVSKFIENNQTVLDKKDIVKLIEIFVDSSKYFTILFEKMDSFHLDYEQDMIHRRIELCLEEGEIDKNKDKIIEIIKDERYAGKYDCQYLVMLFKNKNFLQGVEALSEYHKFNNELLSIYMDRKDYEKIINLCKNQGSTNPSLWYVSLDFFMNKEFRQSLNNEEIGTLNKYLKEFLQKLLESDAMLSIKILEIINEKNNDISLGILNDFFNKAIEMEDKCIEEQKKRYDNYNTQINDVTNEIKDLNTKAYTTDLNKCSECSMPMSLPFMIFECGHKFHNLCLGINKNINGKYNCRKCKEKKNKVIEDIRYNKNYYNSVYNYDKLEKELNKNKSNKDKIDFIHTLYGKGLFNLGAIKDNLIGKETEKEKEKKIE